MSELGEFETVFTEWRATLATVPRDKRGPVYMEMIDEIAHICKEKGLPKGDATEELLDAGLSNNLGPLEELETLVRDMFVRVENEPRFSFEDAPPPRYMRGNGQRKPKPAAELPQHATPYLFPDPSQIPPRAWIFSGHYVRSVVTATVAPGGFGKTTLALFEAISMALMGFRVWYISGEDSREEIDRRIAAHCQWHEINAIAGRLFVDDKETYPFFMGKSSRAATAILDEKWLGLFEHAIRADKIDVVMLDPFIGFHAIPENDNGAIDQLVKRLAAITFRTRSCVEMCHHVRKAAHGQTEITVEDTRGGGAIVNAVRSSRVINRMSEREADLARIQYDQRNTYLRLDKGKRNMAPPEAATWFHLISVHLPNGDNVQAIERWEFPSVFEGLTPADVGWVQDLLRERPRRASSQSEDWLGHHLGARFNRDVSTKEGAIWANKIIGEWMRNGVFKKMPLRDPETRKPNVPFYVVKDFQNNVLPFKRLDLESGEDESDA